MEGPLKEDGRSLMERTPWITKSSPLLMREASDLRTGDYEIELKSFRLCLSWICLDQSSYWKTGLTWSVFLLLAIGTPMVSHFFLSCSTCDNNHRRPYDGVIQLSLSLLSALSFFNLSHWSRSYGLKKFLFLDKLQDESEAIRNRYNGHLQKAMRRLCIFVLPCFLLESFYRTWWYSTGRSEIPYVWNMYVSDTVICVMQLCSWVYRISTFILVCIMYQLICSLHQSKLEDFCQVFQEETGIDVILKEHLKLRCRLRVISHRFRGFILFTLVIVTGSQAVSLLMTTRSSAHNNIFEAGELALCSINMVTGLFICLRSATKITHKAHSITSLAAKWHAWAAVCACEDINNGCLVSTQSSFPTWVVDEDDDGSDDQGSVKIFPVLAETMSFQKRQAIVSYLENNKAGMTVYGFTMDRAWLHGIFGIEMALLLWLLNKTIGTL